MHLSHRGHRQPRTPWHYRKWCSLVCSQTYHGLDPKISQKLRRVNDKGEGQRSWEPGGRSQYFTLDKRELDIKWRASVPRCYCQVKNNRRTEALLQHLILRGGHTDWGAQRACCWQQGLNQGCILSQTLTNCRIWPTERQPNMLRDKRRHLHRQIMEKRQGGEMRLTMLRWWRPWSTCILPHTLPSFSWTFCFGIAFGATLHMRSPGAAWPEGFCVAAEDSRVAVRESGVVVEWSKARQEVRMDRLHGA